MFKLFLISSCLFLVGCNNPEINRVPNGYDVDLTPNNCCCEKNWR